MNINRFRVKPKDKHFKLRKLSTNDTDGVDQKEAEKLLDKCRQHLADLQDRLYAQDRYAVLVMFQAMDAAGKDGTIKYVMSGVNPQGCQVFSFKAPSAEELDHDYLWRYWRCLPERGRIGIFNRSYYEEVLVVRVHQEFLEKQKLPYYDPKGIWDERFEDINNVERYFVHNGVIPIKFFLNVSKEEQLARFIRRLDKPDKNWKFSANDAKERDHWDDYMDAFQDMLRHTSTKHAPWYVIPADRKWFMRAAVAEVIANRLEELDLHYPRVSKDHRRELKVVRQKLTAEA